MVYSPLGGSLGPGDQQHQVQRLHIGSPSTRLKWSCSLHIKEGWKRILRSCWTSITCSNSTVDKVKKVPVNPAGIVSIGVTNQREAVVVWVGEVVVM